MSQVGDLWVDLELKSGNYMKDMELSQKKFQNTKKAAGDFSASMTKVGASMVVVGGAIVGSLALAANAFAGVGDKLAKMSLRTGISTQSLQELGHAAELSGSDIGAIEVSIRKMSKVIIDASDGLALGVDALDAIGMSVKDLEGLKPDEQFTKMAMAIAKLEDPTARSAAAQEIFGRSGTALLPMFADGEEGLKKMREETSKYATILSDEGVASAVAYTDNMFRLKTTMTSIWVLIGQAVTPAMEKLVGSLQKSASMVKTFAEENPKLVATLASIALVLGGVLAGFGGVLLVAAKLLTSFTSLLPMLIKLGPAFTKLFSIIAAHPLVAVTLALSAATLALLNWKIAQVDAANAAINTGKTIGDLIKRHKDEIAVIKEKMKNTKLSIEDQAKLQEESSRLYTAIAAQEKRLTKEKVERQKEVTKLTKAELDAIADANAEIAAKMFAVTHTDFENRKKDLTDEYNHFLKLGADKQSATSLYNAQLAALNMEQNAAIENQNEQSAQREIELIEGQANFTIGKQIEMLESARGKYAEGTLAYKSFTESIIKLEESKTSTISAALKNWRDNFGSSMASMIKRTNSFDENFTSVVEGLKDQFFSMATEMAAQWIMKHALMTGATLLWKQIEIVAAAAVAAAKAAAATAFTLWGALAIGASIGAGVIALGKSFDQGGILNEPVVGVGLSTGRRYSFAENEPEMFTPRSKAGKGGGSSSVKIENNINIASVDNNNVSAICEKITRAIKAGNIQAGQMVKTVTKEGSFRVNEAY